MSLFRRHNPARYFWALALFVCFANISDAALKWKKRVPDRTVDAPLEVIVAQRSNKLDTPIAEVMRAICGAAGFVCYFQNESYTGGVDVMIFNFELDLNMQQIATYPHTLKSITFAVLKPRYVKRHFQFLKVYDTSTWITILLTTTLASLVMYFAFRRRITLPSSFFYVWSSLFGQYHDWKPESNVQSILAIFLSCGIMLISLCYSSALLSIMTMPTREKGIKDSNDLYDAVSKGIVNLTEYKNANIAERLLLSSHSTFHFFGEELQKNVVFETLRLADIMRNNSISMIHYRNLLELHLNEDYYVFDENILTAWFTMLINPYFCCKNKINTFIHRIWASGIYNHLEECKLFYYKIHFPELIAKSILDDGVRPLNISDLSGAFYVLIFGLSFGFMVFVIEIIYHYFSQ